MSGLSASSRSACHGGRRGGNGREPVRAGQDRRGQFSIRINDQWWICFTWKDGDAYDVEIVDYH